MYLSGKKRAALGDYDPNTGIWTDYWGGYPPTATDVLVSQPWFGWAALIGAAAVVFFLGRGSK